MVVVFCNLRRLPSELVHVDMSVPFGHDGRFVAVHHEDAVDDKDVGEVGVLGVAFAHVDDDEVTVGDAFVVAVLLAVGPDVEQAALFLFEADVFEGASPLGVGAVDLTNPTRRAAGGAELLHVHAREHLAAGEGEGLDVVGGAFRSHVAMVVALRAFQYVPVEAFEPCACFPQMPEIGAGFLAVGVCCAVVAVLVEARGEVLTFLVAVEINAVPFHLFPRDKESIELAFAVFGGEVFVVEEVASAVGSGLVDNHGVRFRDDTLHGGAYNLVGGFFLGSLPKTHLGEMGKSVSIATDSIRSLIGSDGNGAVALGNFLVVASLTDINHCFLVAVVFLSEFIEHIQRVVLQSAVIHGLDGERGFFLLRHNDGVETLLVNELQPSHIKLDAGRAAPLSGFEQDETNRFVLVALPLKGGNEFALCMVEFEEYFALAGNL